MPLKNKLNQYELDMALAVYRGETHFSELSMEPYRRYDKT